MHADGVVRLRFEEANHLQAVSGHTAEMHTHAHTHRNFQRARIATMIKLEA